MSIAPVEVPVEVLELSPRWLAGGLAASFARVQILIAYYGGDPRRWLEALEREETPADADDIAFLRAMQERMAADPDLVHDMRRIVAEFANRFGSTVS